MNIIHALGYGSIMLPAVFQIRSLQKEIRRCRAAGDIPAEIEAISQAEYAWGRYVVDRFGIDLRVTGLEHIPEGPVVFVSNHQSFMDIPIYTAAIPHKEFSFVAKKDLLKIPLYGTWMQDIRCVMLDREDSRSALNSINEGIELLKQGFSLVVFPEGTRGSDGVMKEFRKGSLRLAVKPGVPVVPITFNGSYHSLEEQGRVRPAVVDFHIHPAIETKNMDRKEGAELAQQVEAIVRDKLTQLQEVDHMRRKQEGKAE